MDQSAIDHALGNIPPAAEAAAKAALNPLQQRIAKLEKRLTDLEAKQARSFLARIREALR